jgi:predicted transcriptional regulator
MKTTQKRGITETTVTFRMSSALKEEVASFARERGETMTAFVCRALHDATRPGVRAEVIEEKLAARMSEREGELREQLLETQADLDAAKRVIARLKGIGP